MLKALFTAEALLHTSYSFFGNCGSCRNNKNNEIIIPSNGGIEIAFVCTSLNGFVLLAELPLQRFLGCFGAWLYLWGYTDHSRPWISPQSKNPPPGNFSLPRAQHMPAPVKTHAVPYLGKDRQEMQTADGRELNSD